MAEVMNAGGYCSTKWIDHCRTNEQKRFEGVRVEDGDSLDETIKEILRGFKPEDLPVTPGLCVQ